MTTTEVLPGTVPAVEDIEGAPRRYAAASRHLLQPAIVGATGYAGLELVKLLSRHPGSKAPLLFQRPVEGAAAMRLSSMYPQLAGTAAAQNDAMHPLKVEAMVASGVDVVFLATPHEQSRELVPEALEAGLRVVDLSGAWRLREATNRAVYKFGDEGGARAEETQRQAVYGCPELHREQLKGARLVANPGCYATSIILALAPLLQLGMVDVERGIICDSKSGVSGAGKQATATTHFMHAADNLSVYGVYGHRHLGEIAEQLQLTTEQLTFTPQLLPVPRGILSCIYVQLRETQTPEFVQNVFAEFYAASPMVRVLRAGALPELQHVVHTNFCDIGFVLSPERRRLTIVSCLDNLLKGAAAQAVQNMNVVFGFTEDEGLR